MATNILEKCPALSTKDGKLYCNQYKTVLLQSSGDKPLKSKDCEVQDVSANCERLPGTVPATCVKCNSHNTIVIHTDDAPSIHYIKTGTTTQCFDCGHSDHVSSATELA